MKTSRYLIDTGILIALLDRGDEHHPWALRTVDDLRAPLATCESVLSEAWFLARRGGADPIRVLDLAEGLGLDVLPVWSPIASGFLRAYPERASVADAGLLALAQIDEGSVVVTTDVVDFSVYRINRGKTVPVIMPPG